MPHFNPNKIYNFNSYSSDTLRSSRSPSLAPYTNSHKKESEVSVSFVVYVHADFLFEHLQGYALELLTSPFNPDQTKYIGSVPQMSPSPSPKFEANSSSYPFSPILPLTASPSRPVTTSSIPPDCFEEFVIHPPHKNKKLDLNKWGGVVDFRPIEVTDNKCVLGTPMRDCLSGFGLNNPDERLFQGLADAGKSHIEFMIMVSWSFDLERLI